MESRGKAVEDGRHKCMQIKEELTPLSVALKFADLVRGLTMFLLLL